MKRRIVSPSAVARTCWGTYHCVEPPVQGSTNVENFLKHDTKETLGSVMTVNVDPKALAKQIVADIEEKRRKLGWD